MKQAVKSPKPNQKQTNQHHNNAMLDWQKSKHYRKPKTTPNRPQQPDGAKQQDRQKHHALTKREAHHAKSSQAIIGSPNHHRHTPKGMHTHAAYNTKHTTTKNQMHWHTIEFSNNTSTPNTPTKPASLPKRLTRSYTTKQTKVKPKFNHRSPNGNLV
ncbi:hypothetical protein IAU68_02820 [Corynebacterium lujinxingii]|uniref:Uncharacterized protein n=1 Tax=Corynebacterium lujinxingii TaxID=2763010 RepID=A0A7H0K0A6_9CORY|nr:hypothetical protein [Corynebacterium lujinxingii]QNP90722.1 hypothetical protein IAU68_02820 [Corynebacterium lujinxingii]